MAFIANIGSIFWQRDQPGVHGHGGCVRINDLVFCNDCHGEASSDQSSYSISPKLAGDADEKRPNFIRGANPRVM